MQNRQKPYVLGPRRPRFSAQTIRELGKALKSFHAPQERRPRD